MLFVGMQVCCAQELGRGRLKKVSVVFSITVYVGTILLLVMAVFTMMFSEKIAILLGATGKDHGFDKKTSFYASLALQELADNIVKYGFTNKQLRDNMIDFRAVYKKDKLVVSIRDNCPKFDVTAKISEVNAERVDLSKGIGIRIVSKIASNIKYLNTFEMNTIIFEFQKN